MPAQMSLVDRSVSVATRRLVGQSLLNNLSGWLALTTGLALGWFILQPLLFEYPPVWLRWGILTGMTAIGLGMAIWQTVRSAPSKQTAALEVDNRFNLRERVTTSLALTPDLHNTPAGEALAADVEAKVKPLNVREKFPLKLRWVAALIPAFALTIVAVVLWWHPSPLAFGGTDDPKGGKNNGTQDGNKPVLDPTKKQPTPQEAELKDLQKRENRDEKLTELDKELQNLDKRFDDDPYDDLPEKAREKAAELTKLEEKVEKFTKEREQELKELADKLAKLEDLSKDDELTDKNGAKPLTEALAKGDLEKAEEEIDELKKKTEDKELTPEEAENLSRELEKVKDELERLQRENEEKQQELEKKRDEAKKENRPEDAEELDRELERLKQEQQAGQEEMQELAEQLKQAGQALEKNDQEKAAEALEKAGKAVERMQGQVEDLREAEMRLQKLKSERQKACAACEANGDKKADELIKAKSGPNKGGIGAGEREINKDADTDSEETRIRSLMDLRGETQFGGLTEGKGFKKKTDRELGDQIKKAVQDAPGAADLQRLPRDAKESVAEYFKKLGGTEKK